MGCVMKSRPRMRDRVQICQRANNSTRTTLSWVLYRPSTKKARQLGHTFIHYNPNPYAFEFINSPNNNSKFFLINTTLLFPHSCSPFFFCNSGVLSCGYFALERTSVSVSAPSSSASCTGKLFQILLLLFGFIIRYTHIYTWCDWYTSFFIIPPAS